MKNPTYPDQDKDIPGITFQQVKLYTTTPHSVFENLRNNPGPKTIVHHTSTPGHSTQSPQGAGFANRASNIITSFSPLFEEILRSTGIDNAAATQDK